MKRKKDEIIAEMARLHEPERAVKLCDAPGCCETGDYRAPQSRDALDHYFWFCMEHVRDYNRRWNFYAGMNEIEIERQIRFDTTWQRPTWPLGAGANGRTDPIHLGMFGPDAWHEYRPPDPNAPKDGFYPRPGSVEADALEVFRLDAPVTRTLVKDRYKVLVKKHHPDTNRNDPKAEEKLKSINQAYSILISCAEL